MPKFQADGFTLTLFPRGWNSTANRYMNVRYIIDKFIKIT